MAVFRTSSVTGFKEIEERCMKSDSCIVFCLTIEGEGEDAKLKHIIASSWLEEDRVEDLGKALKDFTFTYLNGIAKERERMRSIAYEKQTCK